MLLRVLLFHLFFLAVWGGYPVPDDCLHCICVIESFDCSMPNPLCKDDRGSDACGPFQIHQDYWTDATMYGGDLMGSWKACAANWDCSKAAVQAYMTRYATYRRLGHTPGCEDFSRLHNGGLNGHTYLHPTRGTTPYWKQVQACLNSRG